MKRSDITIIIVLILNLIIPLQFAQAQKYIALNPSNQTDNLICGGGTEADYATILVNQAKVKLESLGYTVRIFLGGPSDNVPTAVNTWNTQNGGANAFVSMHTNAGKGGCIETRSYSTAVYNKDHKASDITLANNVVDGLVGCLGLGRLNPEMWWNTNSVPPGYGNLGILRGVLSSIPCCVEEALFHDNSSNAAILKSSAGQEKIASGVANGIDLYFGGTGNPCIGGTTTPPNDNPCDAGVPTLTVGTICSFTQGTNLGATNSSVPNLTNCDGTSNGDIWFKFIVPNSGHVIINSNAGTINDMGMALYTGSSCNSLSYYDCYPNGSTYSQYMPYADVSGLTPNTTMWIRMWEFNNNNFGTFSICVTSPSSSLPDLRITPGAQTVNPNPVNSGSTIIASCSEDNIGNASAGANHVGLWLSSDNILNELNDIYLGQITFPLVAANSCSAVLNSTVQIPSNTGTGIYYLFFWADGNKVISESDESNNFASTQITVTNIAPSTLTVNPTSLTLGSATNSNEQINVTSNISWASSPDVSWLSVTPVSGSNNGSITVTATSENTLTTSRSGTVSITGIGITKTVSVTQNGACNPVAIVTQPKNQSVLIDNTATFSITASGTSPFTYQWYKNNSLISAATSYSYTTPILSLSDNGNTYYCYITNCSGNNNITSNAATLIVSSSCSAVSIGVQPSDQTASVGNTATFSVTASGTAPFTYQWYKNGSPIVNATSSSYTTLTLTIADKGNTYYCYVTNCLGSYNATSNTATVDVYNYTQTSSWDWIFGKSAGGSGCDAGNNIAIDLNGNIYVTGYFYSSSITFGNYTLTNAGGKDIFIVKYDNWGNVLWAKSIGGTGDDEGYGIATDKTGNVFITGNFSSPSITFETITLTNSGFFISKYNSNGNVLWAKEAKGAVYHNNGGNCIATDASNNVCITGSFYSSLTFGSFFLTNIGNPDIYLVKYDTFGNVLWAKQGDGGAYDYDFGNGIAIDNNGNIYITGYCGANTRFDGYMGGIEGMFIVPYTSSGAVQWVYQPTSGGGIGSGITTDANGGVYATGWFVGSTISFGGNTATNANAGKGDILLVSLGNPCSVWSVGGSDEDKGYGIATDISGNVYITGYFKSPSITFPFSNTLTNTNTGSDNIFAVKYGSGFFGNVSSWAKSARGIGNAISTDSKESNIFVTGSFYNSSCTFGSDILINSGCNDMFTAKIGCAYPSQPTSIFGSSNICQGSSQTYFVNSIPNATSYIWSLPSDWSGNSTASSIISTAGSISGKITVKGQNLCGIGPESTLAIIVNEIPSTPVIALNNSILQSSFANGNQWYFSNNIIQNAVNNTYMPTQRGDYYVIVTLNNCSSQQSNTITFIPTGINEIVDNNGISIYPNPTSGIITVSIYSKFNSDYIVEIYDNVGGLLQSLKNNKSVIDFDIDLGKSPAGLYIIHIHAANKNYENKVMKK